MKLGYKTIISCLLALLLMTTAEADPLWIFKPDPAFPHIVTVDPVNKVRVKYEIRNLSKFSKNLVLLPQLGVKQVTPCLVGPKNSINPTCILDLEINGSLVPSTGIFDGPVLCENGNLLECYGPNPKFLLQITKVSLKTLSVGGTISGLMGPLTLLLNGSNAYQTDTDGDFSFSKSLPDGSSYFVSVGTQPPFQTCTVSNAFGTLSGAAINNVVVTCSANTFTLNGNIFLPAGSSGPVVLTDNTSNPPTVGLTASGAFSFPTALAQGSPYNVEVKSKPANLNCAVSNGTGQIQANVFNVEVHCSFIGYPVGGVVNGIGEGVTVRILLNGQEEVIVDDINPQFAFQNIPASTPYTITVPDAQGFACVSNCSGVVPVGGISNIVIAPVANTIVSFATPKSVVSVLPATTTTLTVNNVGAAPAINVQLAKPAGWSGLTITPSASCANIPSGGSCTFDLDSTIPYVADFVTVSADNAGSVLQPTAFSIDGFLVWQTEMPDATHITSQLLDNTDLPPVNPPFAFWGNPGVVTNATDPVDGAQNTNTIATTAGITNSAALNCTNSNVGGLTNWYLPAVCQLGGVGFNQGSLKACPNVANVNSNLFQLGFDEGLADNQTPIESGLLVAHWSSTESAGSSANCTPINQPGSPANCAWAVYYQTANPQFPTALQFSILKNLGLPASTLTRCAVAVTTTI